LLISKDRAGARVRPGPGVVEAHSAWYMIRCPDACSTVPRNTPPPHRRRALPARVGFGGVKGREAAQRTPRGRRAGACSLVAATGRRRGGPTSEPEPRAERPGPCSCSPAASRSSGPRATAPSQTYATSIPERSSAPELPAVRTDWCPVGWVLSWPTWPLWAVQRATAWFGEVSSSGPLRGTTSGIPVRPSSGLSSGRRRSSRRSRCARATGSPVRPSGPGRR
jgi:hypothetical protein